MVSMPTKELNSFYKNLYSIIGKLKKQHKRAVVRWMHDEMVKTLDFKNSTFYLMENYRENQYSSNCKSLYVNGQLIILW